MDSEMPDIMSGCDNENQPLVLKQANSEDPKGGLGGGFLGAKTARQPRAA